MTGSPQNSLIVREQKKGRLQIRLMQSKKYCLIGRREENYKEIKKGGERLREKEKGPTIYAQ